MASQGLTTKELGAVEECFKMEALCFSKARAYEREVEDQELRDICRQTAEAAQRHMDELLEILR